jgi:hypothetical protein
MRPDIARYQKNLREELDESALYAASAAAEIDPTRKDLFLQLSQAEAGHAQLWREKLTGAGVDAERFTPSLRTRVLALVMGVAGAGQASHTILLTGLAGLVAGAVSMALGEWLSVTNAQEFARS